jgi:hypothetical protein
LVFDVLQVNVVGVLGSPQHEGLVGVGDSLESDFALDASHSNRGVSLNHFVADREVLVRNFSD